MTELFDREGELRRPTVVVRESMTPLAELERRVNGEAEARAALAGLVHEHIADVERFAQDTYERVNHDEYRINLLSEKLVELAGLFDQYMEHTDARLEATRVAMQALLAVVKDMQPRPSLPRRITGYLFRNEGY